MNILVTGIAGFIGSRTAQLLLEQGHTVIGIDNLNHYYDLRLKYYRLRELARAQGADATLIAQLEPAGFSVDAGLIEGFSVGNLIYRTCDAENLDQMLQLVGDTKIDIVVNLAARAGVRYSMDNPHIYMTTNAHGTLNLLELMRLKSIPKLVLASTSSLYAGLPMPFVETLPVNTPISPYAATKKAAEAMAYTYHHLYGIDVSIVRYFTVFGPAGRPDMAPYRFTKWVHEGTPIMMYGDGEQSRDFTYIDDVAKGTIAAFKKVGYSIFNLGGGNNPISMNQTIRWMEEFLGKQAKIEHKPFHKADMQITYANIDKAKAELGWAPEMDVKEGFWKTAQWYLDNESWLRDVSVWENPTS